ncbi:MAG: DUF2191 domain-containing protein [bacterium]
MRTTLTLDEDVSALLERLRKNRKVNFKVLVNEALRKGLQEMIRPSRRSKPCHTKSVSLGRCLVGSLDDISEALAIAEGEDFK